VLGGGGKAARTIGERLSDVALDVTPLRAINQGRNRVDLDATFPWTHTTHYRLGFFDLGEGNKLNVQAGRTLRPGFAARFGFHASKLGLGFDFGNRLHPAFAVDIYGVDRTRVDARGALPLTSYFDITLGLDNVTKRADPTVGVRYRR